MDVADWHELDNLRYGAEKAILSGQLNEWQHANTSSFHVLCTAIMDLHDRLAKLETSTTEPMEDAPVNGPSIYRGDKF